MKKQNVVLFDFDGTLSAKDANMEFYKYCLVHSIRPWIFMPITLLAMIIRIFTGAAILWRQMARLFMTEKMVKKLAPGFIKKHKLERFGWAKEQVQKESDAGNMVICLSASPNYLIPNLVDDMAFDFIMCSDMFDEKPWKYEFFCHDINKVFALDALMRDLDLNPVVLRAYSDHKSDIPMMNLAKEQIWIDPKTGLRK